MAAKNISRARSSFTIITKQTHILPGRKSFIGPFAKHPGRQESCSLGRESGG
jgi:hypothetical protein